MSRNFDTRYGPTALVTGAANGIGRAFAFGLARRGLSLLLVDVDAEALGATAEAIRGEAGVSVDTCVADLSDSAELDRVCEVARSAEIGLLVNNAGIGHSAAFLEIPLEEHLKALDVNVRASLVLTHRLAPAMCERERGGLIFTSSMSALVGPPGVAQYASTKAYLRQLAEALYGELFAKGIDVLALLPGLTRTKQVMQQMSAEAAQAMPAMDPESVAEAAINALGKKRYVIPGFANKLQAVVFPRLPRGILLRRLGRDLTNRAWHD